MEPMFVTENRLPEMREALAKLQKRAARHGLTRALYRVGSVACMYPRTYDDALGRRRTWHEPKFPVWVDAGDPIRVAGWDFIARLEMLGGPERAVLLHVVPGREEALEPRWRDPAVMGRCDHCGLDRRRKDTYVVSSAETGEQRQIGRTCLRDFLGCDTPESVIRRFEYERSMRDLLGDDEGRPRFEYDALTLYVLALTATLIRLRGWMSKAAAREHETPTAGLVSRALFGTEREADELRKELRAAHTDADEERAARAMAYWSGREGGSEYEQNLQRLLRCEVTLARHLGLVCSALPSWARATSESLDGKPREEPVSRALGAVGERLKGVQLALVDARSLGDSGYGPRVLLKFRAPDGAVATWITGSAPGLDVGDQVTIDGTVKKVAEYRGVLETQLSRCRLTSGPVRIFEKERSQ